ncbi:MAG: AI-2E family transporter [Pseudoxanthomonas suwonensis]|nr:AI-2E family transporter [Pseudoxanthomonas suwonensis]
MLPARESLQRIAAFFDRVQHAAIIIAVLWLVSRLSVILVPFVIAALLGWMGDPLVDRLEARGSSRNTAVLAVFTAMTLVVLVAVLLLVPLLSRQVVTLVESWPQYQGQVQGWFTQRLAPWLLHSFGFDLLGWFDTRQLMELLREHWQRAGGVAVNVLGFLSRSGLTVVVWSANLVLIPVLTFFFLRDWDRFVERLAALVPRDHLPVATRLAHETDEVLGGFLRGQFLVMVALGLMYGVGLALVGVNLGALIGIVGGILSFVPYIGPASVVVMGVIATLVQGGGVGMLIGVGVVFTVAQLVESYLLTPKLVGDRIGLHPMAVIFAVMAGGVLFGFVGMLIALPAAAVMNVMLRYAVERYRVSPLYVGEGAPEPMIVVDERIAASETPPRAAAPAHPGPPPPSEPPTA